MGPEIGRKATPLTQPAQPTNRALTPASMRTQFIVPFPPSSTRLHEVPLLACGQRSMGGTQGRTTTSGTESLFLLGSSKLGNSCNVSHLSMLFSVLNHVGFLSVALCRRRRHGTTIRSIARIVVPSGMSPRPCFCTANSLSGANFAVIPQKTNFSAELGDFFF